MQQSLLRWQAAGAVALGILLFGALQLAIGGGAPVLAQIAGTEAAARISSAPQISFWYGTEQQFGQRGNPTPWVNVLGHVTSTVGIRAITYTLNSGVPQPLALGPDTRRLAASGDFNLELAIVDLHAGPNRVVVTAIDTADQRATATMTVTYTPGTVWPLPATVEWGSATTIQAAAPVVDGQWIQAGETIRPVVMAYDRLISIGDLSWESYEVVVPVTIQAINAAGYAYPSSGPGVGILVRWQGHYQEGAEQPRVGWRNLGALGWFRWELDGHGNPLPHGQLLGYNGVQLTTNYQLVPVLHLPYLMRMQVETVADAGDWYRFKVWPAAQSEPAAWQMVAQGFVGEPTHGSLLLVAHEADASFGTVAVCPLHPGAENHFRPQIHVVGAGEITLTPDQASYRCGEMITLQATPAPGWQLAAWQGAAEGHALTYTFPVRGGQAVTATFALEPPPARYTLTTPVVGNGAVTYAPQLPSYPAGMTVTLTATTASGWQFAGWRLGDGSLPSFMPTLTVVMNSNQVVTATFTPLAYHIHLASVGQGTVSSLPVSTSYGYGTAITLTAQPTVGWRFIGWQGDVQSTANPLTLTMTQDYTMTAHFHRTEVTFTVAVEGEGEITTSLPPGGYPYGTVITATARAAAGSSFRGWGGSITGERPTTTLVLDRSQTVIAHFAPMTYTVTVATQGAGTVLIDPPGPYHYQQQINLRAVAFAGWHFQGWAGRLQGHPNPTQLMLQADQQVTAIFAAESSEPDDYRSYLPLIYGAVNK